MTRNSCSMRAVRSYSSPRVRETALLVTALASFCDVSRGAELEMLEEIVVTASKREESLQDVSASVSALTDEQLGRLGADSFEGFASRVPGLTLNQSTRNAAKLNIRGVATSTLFGGNVQEPVSVYINDTPVTDTYGAAVQPDLHLFDVERVEVLRGPQGTLFGSGSLGGTVRIITKQPKMNEFESAARLDLADTDGGGLRQRYDAMVNVPLSEDRLAMRAVAYFRNEEGWVRNRALGRDNSTEDVGGRLALLWTPGEATSVRLETIYQKNKPEDGDSWNPAFGQFNKSSSRPEGRPLELENYALVIEHDLPDFAKLISATTYQSSETYVALDGSVLPGLGLRLSRNGPFTAKFLTQEIRAVSNGTSAFEWVAGGFFIDREGQTTFNYVAPGVNDLFGGLLPLGDAYLISSATSKSQELAVFANTTYRFAQNWKVSAGLRTFRTEVRYSEPERRFLDFSTFPPLPTLAVQSFNNSGKDDDFTWRVGLSYEPAADVLLYGNISKGFRIGQVNPSLGPSAVDPSDIVIPEQYAPDWTLNYELGAKTAWLDRRLTLNVAVFYIDWSDIQVDAYRLSDAQKFVDNAGNASSKGIEIEVAALVHNLDLALSATFQDSEIEEISAAGSARTGVLTGDRLPGAVEFKIAGSAQYTWQTSAGLEPYVRIDAEHVGSSRNNFSNLAGAPGTPNPYLAMNEAYENVNASLGLIADRWDAAIYGENLGNNDALILTDGGVTLNPVTALRPRTVGVRAAYRF